VGTYEDGTWTGSSKEVVFTVGGTTGNRRISAITIDYEEALPSVATPTFSVASGTYYEAQNVTISTETAGATIYYTTDGTEPTASSSVYSTPIAVTTTMTIKAIAVKAGMDNSAVAVANYAIPVFNSLEDLAAADLTNNTTVKVSFSNVAIKA
jgi:LysM repeat protein